MECSRLLRSKSCSDSILRQRLTYEEVEAFITKTEEEISAAFSSHNSASFFLDSKTSQNVSASPPKVRKLIQQLQKSPSIVRKASAPSLPSPKRLSPKCLSPTGRRVSELASKFSAKRSCKVIKPVPVWNKQSSQSWIPPFLKEFDAIVQEQIDSLQVDKLSQREKQVLLKRNSLPPKPPPRTSKSKLLSHYQRHQLVRSTSCSDRQSLTDVSNKVALFSNNFSPDANMGSNHSNLANNQQSFSHKTYTLPRNIRRISASNQFKGEHPDGPASSCQLIRVGPRLSRSHSLDETFVPLSQRTYFEPTPSTPAPTPLLNKVKLGERIRRIGATESPIRLHSDYSAKQSDVSCSEYSLTRPYTARYIDNDSFRYDSEHYVSSTSSTLSRVNTRPLSNLKHSSLSGEMMVSVSDHEFSSNKTLPTDVSELYTSVKCSPAMVSKVSYPALQGRRHTLPHNIDCDVTLSTAPDFNATSWDALPPAEEVEVMEDKPILSSVCGDINQVTQNAVVSTKNSDTMADLKSDYSEESIRSFRKFLGDENTDLKVKSKFLDSNDDESSDDVPPSLNSSLSTLSALVDSSNQKREDQNDFGSNVLQEKDLKLVNGSRKAEHAEHSIVDKTCAFDTVDHAVPALSSPEPILAKLQLVPVFDKKDFGSGKTYYSVVSSERYKRKKRKTRPKRHSDACLVTKSKAVDVRGTNKRNSTNICVQISPIESSDEGNGNDSIEIDEGIGSYWRRGQSFKLTNDYLTSNLNEGILDNEDCFIQDLKVNKATKKFLREVETRIPKDKLNASSLTIGKNSSSTQTINEQPSNTNLLVSENVSPSISSCWISDNASLDPHGSCMAFSVTEDDTSDEDGDMESDDDKNDDDTWTTSSTTESQSLSISPIIHLRRSNSSPSLSASLDTLDDLNEESGVGTTSTRPSISPPMVTQVSSISHMNTNPAPKLPPKFTMERSTSNLSSEDTGVDVRLNRKVKRTLSSRRAREALHHIQNKKNKNVSTEEAENIELKDQTTQTEEVSTCKSDKLSSVALEDRPTSLSSYLPLFGSSKQQRIIRNETEITSDKNLNVRHQPNPPKFLRSNTISVILPTVKDDTDKPKELPLKMKQKDTKQRPSFLPLSQRNPSPDHPPKGKRINYESYSPVSFRSSCTFSHSSKVSQSTLPFPISSPSTPSTPHHLSKAHRSLSATSSTGFKASSSPINKRIVCHSRSLTVGSNLTLPIRTVVEFNPMPCSVPSKATSVPSLFSGSGLRRKNKSSSVLSDAASIGSWNILHNSASLPLRANSVKELAELEAVECCKWLRAAGFPQYAQMYEELQFPLDLASAERDHSFLEPESLQALYRRLRILNRCARIRLDHQANNNGDESEDDEQQCALSSHWQFQRQSRRWSRVCCENTDGNKMSPSDSTPFKRSGSERIKDSAKAFLKRMESMKSKRKKKHSRENLQISEPTVLKSPELESRQCIDLRSQEEIVTPVDSFRKLTPRHRSLSRHKTSQTEDSSSVASDQSQTSTPLFRSRRRRRFFTVKEGKTGGSDGGGRSNRSSGSRRSEEGIFSDSECTPPTTRHGDMDSTMITKDWSKSEKSITGSKRSADELSLSTEQRKGLKHSETYCFNPNQLSPDTKDFLVEFRNKVSESASSLLSPEDDRRSVYDNVPLIICNKTYQDSTNHMDSTSTSAPDGSGSSYTNESRHASPCPSREDHIEFTSLGVPSQTQLTVQDLVTARSSPRSLQRHNKRVVGGINPEGTTVYQLNSKQMMHIKAFAMFRVTVLLEQHCPANKQFTSNFPNFLKRKFMDSDKDQNSKNDLLAPKVFGLSVERISQKTGMPLPKVITQAMTHLKNNCNDSIGLFRKSGVKSRIQNLREEIDSGRSVDFSTYCAYDVADTVKAYFREMPEALLTNKVSEIMLAIFQYLPECERHEAVQWALLMLPASNREACLTLLHFLREITESVKENQMTAYNLAVCFAPTLFHFNVGPKKKNTSGSPEQKDLNDNKAAQDCLVLLINHIDELTFISPDRLATIHFTESLNSQPLSLEELGLSICHPKTASPITQTAPSYVEFRNNLKRTPSSGEFKNKQQRADWAAYMEENVASLIREVKEKSKEKTKSHSYPDSGVVVSSTKVSDEHPLKLWRVTTEVEAPPTELLNRVLRERHVWDDTIAKWRIVAKLDHQAEVYQYTTKSLPPKPNTEFCVLRCWRSDIDRAGGSCVLVETSIEHTAAAPLKEHVRGIVLDSRYLIQPCGSGKSRITHISRVDMRGREPEWYNKVYGDIAAANITRVRNSFKHHTEGPESKV